MTKIASAILLCALIGCSGTPPQQESVCATKPGSYACEVHRDSDAGM